MASLDLPYDAVLGLIAVFVFSALWYVGTLVKKPKGPPLPPGPRGLPVVGYLPFLSSELHTHFAELAGRYGPIFKLQLGSKVGVVVSSPEMAREVLKTQDAIFANHDVPAASRVNTYGGNDILWSPYGQEWRMLRKICVSRMLNNATYERFYSLRRDEIRRTVRFLSERSRSGSAVNVGEQIFVTIMNVLSQMMWGATIGDDERESVGAEFRALVNEMGETESLPDVSNFFPFLGRFDFQGVAKRMRGPATQLDRMLNRIIDQRLRSSDPTQGEGQDFLQCLLKIKEEDKNSPLTMNHVKALLTDMVLGGVDTTANALEFTMAELITRPEMMKRAQQEIDQVVGKDNVVEESHLSHLPFLSAVAKETMRLRPILPLLVPHKSSDSSVVAGYTVPKNSTVFVNIWAIQRDPKSWENPLEFDPQRFIGKTDYDYNGNNFSYLPFGSGRRICAAINMGEKMLLYILATFIHSFDWKIPQGQNYEIKEKFGIIMKLKDQMIIVPEPRLSNPNLYL